MARWFPLILSSIAIGLLSTLLDRVEWFPDRGFTPWALLGILWIGVAVWIWGGTRSGGRAASIRDRAAPAS